MAVTLSLQQELPAAIVRAAVRLFAETEIVSEPPPGHLKETRELPK
jgi:hypothetical protein